MKQQRTTINNKKGIGMEYLIPIILGLIVVSIALYFIFNEYFTQEDVSLEICRQSIQLRAAIPNIGALSVAELKNQYPLKCQTNVIDITENDTETTETIIADAMAECWYLFLEGKEAVFAEKAGAIDAACVPCARIHFTPEVQNYYTGQQRIDLKEALGKPLRNTGISYAQYLSLAFQASTSGVTYYVYTFDEKKKGFIIEGEEFKLDDKATTGLVNTIGNFLVGGGQAVLTLPRYINSQQGDLMIFFQQSVQTAKYQSSSLIYFQNNQPGKNPYDVLKGDFQEGAAYNTAVCDYFDGIPA